MRILWTAYYIVVYKFIGPGVWQGNAGAAFIGTLCVLLVFLLVDKAAGRGAALIAAFLSSLNYILIIYSRTPLPYIGVCISAVLCFYLWFALKNRPYLLFIPYTLPVIFAFHLKSIAGIVLPAMIIADASVLLLKSRPQWKRAIKPYLIAASVTGALFLAEYFIFRSTAKTYVNTRFESYVYEVSFMEIVRGFLSLGFESDYFIQTPLIALLAFVFPVILIKKWRNFSENELRLSLGCIAWLLISLIAFGMLKYRLLQYFIVMSPPMIILSALCLREIASAKNLFEGKRSKPGTILGFLMATYIIYQLTSYIVLENVRLGSVSDFMVKSVGVNIFTKGIIITSFGTSWILPLSIIVAFLITLLWLTIRKKIPEQGIILKAKSLKHAAFVLFAASVAINLYFFLSYIVNRDYSCMHVPREIPALVGENAKIGEHGSSFASFGNKLESERVGFNYSNGIPNGKNTTHLFVSFFRLGFVRPDKPAMAEDTHIDPVAMLTVANTPVILYRLKKLPENYIPSHYEKGEALLRTKKYESALQEFQKALKNSPDSGILKCAAGYALLCMRKLEKAEFMLKEAYKILPEDLSVNTHLVECLTLENKYEEAYEHLEKMRARYNQDIVLRRATINYGEAIRKSRKAGRNLPKKLSELLKPVIDRIKPLIWENE